MRVRLLGPVDVMAGTARSGRSAACGGRPSWPPWRCTSARSSAPTAWSTSVWGETAPPAALNTLQSHVSYLRTVLGGKAAIVARPPGYVLDLGDDGTDVLLAERLLRQGTQSADPARACRGPAGGAGAVARAAAGRRGRAGLAGGAGGAAGPAPRADQARPVRGEAGGRGAPAADARPGADGGRPPARRADPRAADAGAVPQRAAGRRAGRLPAAAVHPGRGARASRPSPALRELETAILRQDASLDASAARRASLRSAAPPRRRAACRSRRSCRRRWRRSPDATRSWPASTRSWRRPGGRGRRRHHRGDHRAPPAWARRRWPCTGRTGSPRGFPTGSCTSTCAASTRAGPRWTRAEALRGFLDALRRCRRSGSRPDLDARSRSTAACWPASGCSWCSTTPATPSRCGRCCPARPAAWPS